MVMLVWEEGNAGHMGSANGSVQQTYIGMDPVKGMCAGQHQYPPLGQSEEEHGHKEHAGAHSHMQLLDPGVMWVVMCMRSFRLQIAKEQASLWRKKPIELETAGKRGTWERY